MRRPRGVRCGGGPATGLALVAVGALLLLLPRLDRQAVDPASPCFPTVVEPLRPVPIDAVVLWVNGSDPWYRSNLRHYASAEREFNEEAVGRQRSRDNGELQFLLRSLHVHAPWLRRIHVITNGPQRPAFLVEPLPLDSKLRVVPHSTFFKDPGSLPTFNSNAIAAQLHLLPGLAPFFILFDDDMFVGRPLEPRFFFDRETGGIRLFVEQSREIGPPTRPLEEENNEWATLYATRQLLVTHLPRAPRTYYPTHGPLLVDTAALREAAAAFPDAFRGTAAHRFRHPHDLHFHFLHDNYLRFRRATRFAAAAAFHELDADGDGALRGAELEALEAVSSSTLKDTTRCALALADLRGGAYGGLLRNLRRLWEWREELRAGATLVGKSPVAFSQLTDDVWAVRDALREIDQRRPPFFCLNDNMEEDYAATVRLFHKFLRHYFPTRAPWEVPR